MTLTRVVLKASKEQIDGDDAVDGDMSVFKRTGEKLELWLYRPFFSGLLLQKGIIFLLVQSIRKSYCLYTQNISKTWPFLTTSTATTPLELVTGLSFGLFSTQTLMWYYSNMTDHAIELKTLQWFSHFIQNKSQSLIASEALHSLEPNTLLSSLLFSPLLTHLQSLDSL